VTCLRIQALLVLDFAIRYTPQMVDLKPVERRALRARAHHLHPVVIVGEAGLTQPVLKEIDASLKSHELIKIRVPGDDRAQRERLVEDICSKLEAGPVQIIGKMLVIYRPRPEEAGRSPSVAPRPKKEKRRIKRGKHRS
jgi:putative YhbY family RNA-binding protein